MSKGTHATGSVALNAYRSGQRSVSRGRAHHRRHTMTMSVAVLGGLMAGLAEPATLLIAGHPGEAMKHATYNYTGWNSWESRWQPMGMQRGLMPLLIGVGVHKIANAAGVNRMLARAKIPFLRI